MIFRKFGSAPSGVRLERIKKSPQYKNGKFQNRSFTPNLAEGYSYTRVIFDFLFRRPATRIPKINIPSVQTDLLALEKKQDVLIWFGHSSYFLQTDGVRFLIDPVFSGNASPLPGTNKAFRGSNSYQLEHIPDFDFLIFTHDHYDHLDYPTVVKLKSTKTKIICPLGVGSHLEYWGIDSSTIIEGDWNDHFNLQTGIDIHFTPARHFSGRGLTNCNTLWCSYVLKTPTKKLYLGGDSGYDSHFAEIGNQFGPFDLALLDNGQYDNAWPFIHMHPEDVIRATKDLKAEKFFPVHSSKFAMANHAWNEPLLRISALCKEHNISMISPMIGEVIHLNDKQQRFREWWTDLE